MSAVASDLHVPLEYATIQQAIDNAEPGDRVVVHPGIYTELDIVFGGKAIEVTGLAPDDPAVVSATRVDALRQGVVFRFASDDESGSVLRGLTITGGAWNLGSAAGGGIYVADSSPTIDRCVIEASRGSGIRCEGASPQLIGLTVQGNEARFGAGIHCNASAPLIDGCGITGNALRGYGGGGGIYCGEQSAPTISDCSVTDNSYVYYLLDGGPGGGICCDASSPRISDCWIADNETADGNGGGVACRNQSSALLERCTITGNEAATGIDGGAGGGVCCEASAPTIVECTISDNLCAHEFHALGRGGGVRCYQANPTLVDCVVEGNVALGGGSGGGVSCESSAPSIEDCVVRGNEVRYGSGGAGLDCRSANPELIRCVIDSNWVSSNEGTGGIECVASSPLITGCTIRGNRGQWDGPGGVHCSNSSPSLTSCLIIGNTQDLEFFAGPAGVACSDSSFPSFTHCTIADNRHPGQDAAGGIASDSTALPAIASSIVWGNTPIEISGSATVSFSDVSGGWPGADNLDQDPLFRDPAAGDYRLSATACAGGAVSPAIDAGDSLASDMVLDCAAGLGGSRADMGAFGGSENRHWLAALSVTILEHDSTAVAGGPLAWTFSVTNNRERRQSGEVWFDAFSTDGSPYAGNPFARVASSIPALQTRQHSEVETLPLGTPPGSPYRICVLVGEHPNLIEAEDCFEFAVSDQ